MTTTARRQFLTGALGGAAMAVVGPLLTACPVAAPKPFLTGMPVPPPTGCPALRKRIEVPNTALRDYRWLCISGYPAGDPWREIL